MKTLVLKDGTSLQLTDSSNINNLIVVVSSFKEVEDCRQKLSEENLSDCYFEATHYTDVLLDTVSAFAKGYGNVQVSFFTKTQSSEEIDALKQQIAELKVENANLTDKAEAADILMGNEEV